MEQIDTFVKEKLRGISREQKALFISVFVVGILSHGYMLVNNIAYHDAVLAMNTLGATYNLGRWGLGILQFIGEHTLGVFGTPLFHGILSLFLIAVSGILIVEILQIRYTVSAVYTGAVMAAFPVVTSIFAYMYTSVAYWLALLLNVLAVYLLVEKMSVKRCCFSALLLAFALGLYQAYFAVAVTLFIMILIINLLHEPKTGLKEIMCRGVQYLTVLLGSLCGYLVVNKFVMTLGKIGVSSYQGVNEMGKLEITKLPALVKSAYYNWGIQIEWNGINASAFLKFLIIGILLLTLFLVIGVLRDTDRKAVNKWLLAILILILPLGIDVTYMLSTSDSYSVHTLMRYSLVFTFLLPIILLEYAGEKCKDVNKLRVLKKAAENILFALLCAVVISYVYIDNVAYLKADYLQEQTIAYFTTLITEIKGTEGYDDELPVVYIGDRKIEDQSTTEMPFFDNITLAGYNQDLEYSINDYAWKIFAGRHCGFFPREGDVSLYDNRQEVLAMPCYPDKGSIKVIDGAVIVKFSE